MINILWDLNSKGFSGLKHLGVISNWVLCKYQSLSCCDAAAAFTEMLVSLACDDFCVFLFFFLSIKGRGRR